MPGWRIAPSHVGSPTSFPFRACRFRRGQVSRSHSSWISWDFLQTKIKAPRICCESHRKILTCWIELRLQMFCSICRLVSHLAMLCGWFLKGLRTRGQSQLKDWKRLQPKQQNHISLARTTVLNVLICFNICFNWRLALVPSSWLIFVFPGMLWRWTWHAPMYLESL